MQNKRIYSILIVMLILMTSRLVYSVEISKSEETLIFLGNEKIPPIIYKENDETKGIVVDIAKELGKRIGRNIEIQAMDWEQAQDKVAAGQADALLQINPNSDREMIYDFSTKLLESEFTIFRRSENIQINDVFDLKDKKVGVESVGYASYLLKAYDNIDIVVIGDSTSGFNMIDSGELDALVIDRWIGEYSLANSKINGIHAIKEPIEVRDSHIAVAKGNDELLRLINKGLSEIEKDGTMEIILSQWSGKNVVCFTESEVKRKLYFRMFLFVSIIILGAIFLVVKLRRINRQLGLQVKERTNKLQEANEKLQKLSRIDGLTNISNRRCFDEEFEKTWNISLRKNQPLSLILLDIDYFKGYNDTYGHLAGDQSLKTVGNILKDLVKRSGDAVGRFGGDEFVVMLFDTAEEGAMMIAEEIRSTIENTIIVYEDKKTSVTASLGVATMVPNQDLNPTDLIKLADQAMYQAKENGRNKVAILN